ncbi:DUF6252 family protein [Pseudomonas rustica]|uniref:DUF6252 family protein n=1 Tax=Pseudomonas rustica TaxID=2827099 RepID=UPI001BAFA136|nr:DUF6252 family protein [Pseudomonas rustica]MBS4090140.1 hypothetical protein [Pseudomonas rustica]
MSIKKQNLTFNALIEQTSPPAPAGQFTAVQPKYWVDENGTTHLTGSHDSRAITFKIPPEVEDGTHEIGTGKNVVVEVEYFALKLNVKGGQITLKRNPAERALTATFNFSASDDVFDFEYKNGNIFLERTENQ